MGRFILLPCVALLTAASPGSSAVPAVSSEIVQPDASQATGVTGGGKFAKAPEEKKICKQLDTTGSRLPRRACLTEREWKQLQDELDQ